MRNRKIYFEDFVGLKNDLHLESLWTALRWIYGVEIE